MRNRKLRAKPLRFLCYFLWSKYFTEDNEGLEQLFYDIQLYKKAPIHKACYVAQHTRAFVVSWFLAWLPWWFHSILLLGLILTIFQPPPVSQTPSDWDSSKSIAKSMLRDRVTRRKILGYWVLLVLGWIVLGMWIIDGWLAESATRFISWWAACLVLTLLLILFALYDALSVVREEREKREAGVWDSRAGRQRGMSGGTTYAVRHLNDNATKNKVDSKSKL